MTETDLRKLLQESASTYLDFKRDQYHLRQVEMPYGLKAMVQL